MGSSFLAALILFLAGTCNGFNSPSTRSAAGALKLPKSVSQAAALFGATLLGFSLSTVDFPWKNVAESTQFMDIDVYRPKIGEYHPRFARKSWDPKSISLVKAAHADSTGKMSTKLTARKRYLPRIKEGVSKFNLLSTDKSVVDEFFRGSGDKKPGVENLTRAMSLYGASLRVGETPDKISREAEKLTEDFTKLVMKAKANPSKEALAPAAAKLREYISFAETHSVSPIDHYEVE